MIKNPNMINDDDIAIFVSCPICGKLKQIKRGSRAADGGLRNKVRVVEKKPDNQFWFCSDDCVKKALAQQIKELRKGISPARLAELQGKRPCTVPNRFSLGDTIYRIHPNKGLIDEAVITKYTAERGGETIEISGKHISTEDVSDIGNLLFFTREEAEERLADIRNGMSISAA